MDRVKKIIQQLFDKMNTISFIFVYIIHVKQYINSCFSFGLLEFLSMNALKCIDSCSKLNIQVWFPSSI